MRGIVSLPAEYPASFRHHAEHDAIDFAACIDGSASVVIDDVLHMAARMIDVRGIAVVIPRGLRRVVLRTSSSAQRRVDPSRGVPAAPGAQLVDVWINDN